MHIIDLSKVSTASMGLFAAKWQLVHFPSTFLSDCHCNSIGFMENMILVL